MRTMIGLFRRAIPVVALALWCGLGTSAWAGPDATATATMEPGPVPVVRQSTPIPNDPEPAHPAKPKVSKPSASATDATVARDDRPEEMDKPLSHRCFVRDVMAFYDRTHVRCYNPARGKYNFFAVDTSQPVAETLLNKAWKSMRSGKPLTITYAPTAELNPTSCDPQNCRRLIDVLN